MTDVPVTTKKDWSSDQEVRWCPGCGDYSILTAMQLLMPEIGSRREDTVFISGIGSIMADIIAAVSSAARPLPGCPSSGLLDAIISAIAGKPGPAVSAPSPDFVFSNIKIPANRPASAPASPDFKGTRELD